MTSTPLSPTFNFSCVVYSSGRSKGGSQGAMDPPFQAEHYMQKQNSQQLTEVQQSLPASTPILSVQSSYKQSLENLNLQAWRMEQLASWSKCLAWHKKWACRRQSRCGSNFSRALRALFSVWILPFRSSRSATV